MIEFLNGIGVTRHDIVSYVIAVFSSLAVELLALIREAAANEGNLPARYKRWAFPISRIAFALIAAGPLAIILDAQSKAAALYVGVLRR